MEYKQKFTKQDAKKYRELCIERANEIDSDDDCALALSGGTDSVTALFAMLEAGKKPHCYTFHMDGIESVDLKSSRNLCSHFGLELTEVSIDSTDSGMIKDIEAVLPYCELVKKTIIQCMIPWKYMYPAIREKKIIQGIGGDDLFGTQRKVQVLLHNGGDDAIREFRKLYRNDLHYSEGNIIRYASVFGKENIEFYSKAMEDFLLEYSLYAINKPFMKYASVEAFRDYYNKGNFYRDQTEHSYQINSKLRDCHGRLLQSEYNKGNHKAIIGLYNDIARRMKK